MSKFRQILTELPARDMIMTGYYLIEKLGWYMYILFAKK